MESTGIVGSEACACAGPVDGELEGLRAALAASATLAVASATVHSVTAGGIEAVSQRAGLDGSSLGYQDKVLFDRRRPPEQYRVTTPTIGSVIDRRIEAMRKEIDKLERMRERLAPALGVSSEELLALLR